MEKGAQPFAIGTSSALEDPPSGLLAVGFNNRAFFQLDEEADWFD